MSLQFSLYTRSRCGLCDLLHEDLLSLCRGRDVQVVSIDIDRDPALVQRYGLRVPVLVCEGRVICEARLDREAVRAVLDRAAGRAEVN